MLSFIPTRFNFAIIGLVFTCLLFYTSFRVPFAPEQEQHLSQNPGDVSAKDVPSELHYSSNPYSKERSIYRVQNETLGFQEVYMISLPSRTDKRDAFAMQAALTGFTYVQMDGVDGREVPEKALPFTMEQSVNAVGCWRAHLNVVQKMVHERIESALFFEDDADWDISLKQQLVQFARGSRYILKTPEHEIPHSPYGDDWDLLWVGHCGQWVLPADNRRFFVIPDDPTVTPPQFRENVDTPNMSHWEGPNENNRTRIVFASEGGVCTAGYAISQRGARKMLYHMSMLPYNSPVDWGLANLCKNEQYDFHCVSMFPQLVGVSRPLGNSSKWSDIGYGNEAERTVEPASSLNLVYSTRLNMLKLLEGKKMFDSQYYPVTPEEMNIQDIGAAVGHIQVLDHEY